MKKLAILFTGLAFLVTTTSFAGPGDPVKKGDSSESTNLVSNIPEKADAEFNAVENAFNKNFETAKVIRWKETDDFYFVYFVAGQHSMFAAFNKDADMLAVSRNISKSDLPLSVSESLKRLYGDCKIGETVLEMSIQGETTYYISADNPERIYQLKSNAYGDLQVVSKTKKKRLIGSIG